ncbi:MAG: hypothetical protein K6U74_09250 [Firmicutes bacterium]|nr:hypothetical protein [Bacillota bacterium]
MEAAGDVKVTAGKAFTPVEFSQPPIDRVREWLEAEDTFGEKVFGYGACALALIYFFTKIIQTVF